VSGEAEAFYNRQGGKAFAWMWLFIARSVTEIRHYVSKLPKNEKK